MCLDLRISSSENFEEFVSFKRKPKPEIVTAASRCRSLYWKICKRFDLVPVSRFARQIGNENISMKDYGLGSKEIKSLCAALKVRSKENKVSTES